MLYGQSPYGLDQTDKDSVIFYNTRSMARV